MRIVLIFNNKIHFFIDVTCVIVKVQFLSLVYFGNFYVQLISLDATNRQKNRY